MKTPLFLCGLFMVILTAASCRPAYGVRERPADVVYVRPVSPSPAHVWVGGNWVWRGGRYVWQEGYWTSRRPGRQYVEGNWQRGRRGWVWRQGYWR